MASLHGSCIQPAIYDHHIETPRLLSSLRLTVPPLVAGFFMRGRMAAVCLAKHELNREDYMSDEFVQQFLGAPNTREVLEWLRGGAADDFRSLGELGTNEESIAMAQEIYVAGAVEVLAVEIDDYPGEGQNTGKLVIKLPDRPDDRKRVFAWGGTMAESQGFDPEVDSGQSYLFVMLD
jgi:hypothetical protein